MMPVPPCSQSLLTQLTTSPRTCVVIIATASLHPQRRRRNHPIAAVARAAPSKRKRIPNAPPRGASCLYAIGLRAQRRSRGVPRQSKVVAASVAMMAPKNKKTPIAVNPGAFGPPARSRLVRSPSRIWNISQHRNTCSECLRKTAMQHNPESATRSQSASMSIWHYLVVSLPIVISYG